MTNDSLFGADPPSFGMRVAGYAAAVLLVAAATLIGLLIAPHWGTAPVVLLYLAPVLVAAGFLGLWPALFTAVASTLAYNFYFTAPYRTFVIHSPADMVTVAMLFLVALVTSQLAGSMREQARLAQAHASRNATIAGFARRLLSCGSEAEIAQVTVGELAKLFECQAVLVAGDDGESVAVMASSGPEPSLAPSDFAAASATLATGEPAGRGVLRGNLADWQFRPILSQSTAIAAAGLARVDGGPPVVEEHLPLLANLLDQAALALERARLDREARDVVVLRERDRMRSALLASIGEDVKPRLGAIAEVARELKRSGTGDKALVAIVATEAARLDRYIDNLVDVTPGADQEPIEAGPLSIDLFRRQVRRGGEEIRLTPKEFAVLAELARHAGRVLTHAHLLRTVWGPAHQEQIDYLRVAIRALRQKLEADPARPVLILNQPAVGYRLAAA